MKKKEEEPVMDNNIEDMQPVVNLIEEKADE